MKKLLVITTALTGCAVYPHSYYTGPYYTSSHIVYSTPVYVTPNKPLHYHYHYRRW